MNIGTAARASGLSTKTVRYYADIGLVVPDGRSEGGYRQYGRREVAQLVFVRRARAFGFSIDQTRELLGLWEDRNRASADVKRVAEARLGEIDARMRELEELRGELARLVEACRGDERPDCPIIRGFAGGE